MPKVLITGAAGFIGSNLLTACLAKGWDAVGVDDMSNGHLAFVPLGSPLVVDDFSSLSVTDRVRRGEFDVVCHLAAASRVSISVEKPVETHDVNVTRTLKLMSACVSGGVKRFVFASSSSVYGQARFLPTSENHPHEFVSPYGAHKSYVEGYLRLYCSLYGLDSVSLRLFNVFGPNNVGSNAYAMALSTWLTAIKSGKPMRMDGGGAQTRDLCYVDNVVDAFMKAVTHEGCLGARALNIANGVAISNRDLMSHLQKRYSNTSMFNAPLRAGDVMDTLADVSAAQEVLGHVSRVSVWEGIDRTCDWYDKNWDWIKDVKRGM